MIINLKQNEIVTALKGYIQNQGINLVGKEVEIAFTAGRKGSGVCAEMTIEDDVKAFTQGNGLSQDVALIPPGPINRELATVHELTSQLVQEAVVAASVPEGKTVKTSSLFG